MQTTLLFAGIGIIGIASAAITDTACTFLDGQDHKYADSAVNCENVLPYEVCHALYPTDAAVGNDRKESLVEAAIKNCPKTCGYCCLTPAFNCKNKEKAAINCDTVTKEQCKDSLWESILIENCPATCGFCTKSAGDCVDKSEFCKNDLSICKNVDLQAFVKENCRASCGLCDQSEPGAANTTAIAPTEECGDNPTCKSWIANGFCTNTFYPIEQRMKYCGKPCNLC
ncbi:unnamed protein product [Nippostrongylus brasiliensis]|uniref:ShTK domain protein n=1 Tax=Nippostrongylus brasiliensis TaxID=27835 RepID=A0A0N4YJK5_NIPBR|nr:unnamed protein product [Nippostrongylus brasiliensis]